MTTNIAASGPAESAMARFSPAVLRATRERARLSRENVAVLVPCSYSSIVAYELGFRRPPLRILQRLAEIYDYDVRFFFRSQP